MNENFYHLATRVITGEADEQERAELSKLTGTDPSLKKEFEELRRAWDKSSELVQETYAPADWNSLEARISRGRAFRLPMTVWWGAAAGLVLVCSVAFVLSGVFSGMETAVAENGNLEIVLPDQSKVVLKEGSTLKYKKNFEEERYLKLEGEAFFVVTRNTESPFTVKTGATTTIVLGTQFNLSGEGDKVELRVKEGKVSFEAAGEKLIVEKGQAARYETRVVLMNPGSENRLLWAEEKLEFSNTPAATVLSDIAHYYDLEIENRAQLENCTFTGRFHKSGSEEVKAMLEEVLKVKIRVSGNTWVITGGNCTR